jgi:hypothetical protein
MKKTYKTNHMWHAIAVVCSGGIWIPGWIIATIITAFENIHHED